MYHSGVDLIRRRYAILLVPAHVVLETPSVHQPIEDVLGQLSGHSHLPLEVGVRVMVEGLPEVAEGHVSRRQVRPTTTGVGHPMTANRGMAKSPPDVGLVEWVSASPGHLARDILTESIDLLGQGKDWANARLLGTVAPTRQTNTA